MKSHFFRGKNFTLISIIIKKKQKRLYICIVLISANDQIKLIHPPYYFFNFFMKSILNTLFK